jgi:hypothetical protein
LAFLAFGSSSSISSKRIVRMSIFGKETPGYTTLVLSGYLRSLALLLLRLLLLNCVGELKVGQHYFRLAVRKRFLEKLVLQSALRVDATLSTRFRVTSSSQIRHPLL